MNSEHIKSQISNLNQIVKGWGGGLRDPPLKPPTPERVMFKFSLYFYSPIFYASHHFV